LAIVYRAIYAPPLTILWNIRTEISMALPTPIRLVVLRQLSIYDARRLRTSSSSEIALFHGLLSVNARSQRHPARPSTSVNVMLLRKLYGSVCSSPKWDTPKQGQLSSTPTTSQLSPSLQTPNTTRVRSISTSSTTMYVRRHPTVLSLSITFRQLKWLRTA
jgi:hypothetical protein